MENTYTFFSRLIGTMAVILVAAGVAGATQPMQKYAGREKDWKFVLIVGLLGGLFGFYGNISGFELSGAIISVRDIGPMIAGFIGGPWSGLLAGAIAGVHRLTMGGITAVACVVATTIIGLACGLIAWFSPGTVKKPLRVLLIGAGMEVFHLLVVLLLVRPFATALDIVKQIALPFVLVNAAGIALMMGIIRYIETQQTMSVERERLKSELEVANVIQHSLLPELTDTYPGRREVAVSGLMEAAKKVGGDFYDVFFVGQDRLAFLIGDVSGKGVPAALFMANAKIILQNCIRDVPELSEALRRANDSLCEKNEAEMFVTVWVGVLDLLDGSMTFASAGHNPPVLLRGGAAELIKIKNSFVMAGMQGVKYRQEQLKLRPGDAVFLYTDGVTEAMNTAGELYGEGRLLECLNAAGEREVGEVLTAVHASVDAFVKENEQFDDITMLCFKWQG